MHRSMFVILTSPYGSCALHVYEHVCKVMSSLGLCLCLCLAVKTSLILTDSLVECMIYRLSDFVLSWVSFRISNQTGC